MVSAADLLDRRTLFFWITLLRVIVPFPCTCVGAGVVVAQKGFGSQSQSDDRLDLLDDFSQRDVSSDTPNSKAAGVDVKRRKKSIKSFDGGMGAGTSVKVIYKDTLV